MLKAIVKNGCVGIVSYCHHCRNEPTNFLSPEDAKQLGMELIESAAKIAREKEREEIAKTQLEIPF